MQGPGSPKSEAPQLTGYLSSQLQDCEKRYKLQPREQMTKILSAAGLGTQLLLFAWADVQVFIKQSPRCSQCLPDTDTRVAVRWVLRAGPPRPLTRTDTLTSTNPTAATYMLLKRML